MKRSHKYRRILHAINHYVVFFMIMAFVITCCTVLFVRVMSQTMGITLTSENIGVAAKLTFVNVIFLALVYTLIDSWRRRITVDRPVKKIIEASNRIMQGDFTVRIPRTRSFAGDGFNEIIDCINKMAEELSGTETLRTDFIANVSHELKTPLAVMQNYATMLSAPGLSDEERIEYSRSISHASKRLADLISNILKLNKLENQQIMLASERYDLDEQLCECLLAFEDIWEKKSIEICTDIEDGVAVFTDREMMSIVWNNLFSNAMKFTPAGGRVSLALKSDGDYAVVSISDTGCGISPEVGAHIFDKFYQGDTSHSTQGNGLGLALVRRIIDITQSDISVESEMGKGSTFTVILKRSGGGGSQEIDK